MSKIRVYLEPRDIWVGVYISHGAVYICPLPCLVIRIDRAHRAGVKEEPR